MKNFEKCRMVGMFQLVEVFGVYTCLLVSRFERDKFGLSSKFEKFECETRAEHLKNFPKVSSVVSMNSLLLLPRN